PSVNRVGWPVTSNTRSNRLSASVDDPPTAPARTFAPVRFLPANDRLDIWSAETCAWNGSSMFLLTDEENRPNPVVPSLSSSRSFVSSLRMTAAKIELSRDTAVTPARAAPANAQPATTANTTAQLRRNDMVAPCLGSRGRGDRPTATGVIL